MKVSFYYFYGYYEGAQTVTPPKIVAVEDSRGWRFHALARVEGLRAHARTYRSLSRADVIGPVVAVRATATLSSSVSTSAAVASASSLAASAALRRVSGTATASPRLVTRAAHARVSAAQSYGHALASVSSSVASARLRRADVSIGPDEVEAELEDLLLLLEVA